MKVFTIGTDHRKPYDFSRLLFKYGIQVLFDVRSTSDASEEYFRRDGLQTLARAQGADYVFLGNELGGPRHTSTSEWVDSDGFRRGVDIIAHKAGTRVCCVLCTERSPEFCHRRVIAEHVAKAGIEVVHILDENVFWQPPPPRTQPPPRPDTRFRSGPPRRGPFRRRPGPR